MGVGLAAGVGCPGWHPAELFQPFAGTGAVVIVQGISPERERKWSAMTRTPAKAGMTAHFIPGRYFVGVVHYVRVSGFVPVDCQATGSLGMVVATLESCTPAQPFAMIPKNPQTAGLWNL